MAIYGIFGGIGSGKTMTLAYLGLQDLYKGKKIYSNVTLKVPKRYKKQITYLDKDTIANIFEKIKNKDFDMMNATVLLQEAHNYVDSRNSASKKNKTFGYWILQSRHSGKGTCDIIYDTQEIGQVDKRLRNNTDFFIFPEVVEKLIDGYPLKIGAKMHGKLGQKWVKMFLGFNCSEVLDKYDTHELVEF